MCHTSSCHTRKFSLQLAMQRHCDASCKENCLVWHGLYWGRMVLQYCCCLIAILTAWKTFMKISHRKGSTRVKNDRDVMCLPGYDVTGIIFAMFKMCTSIFSWRQTAIFCLFKSNYWLKNKKYLFFVAREKSPEKNHPRMDILGCVMRSKSKYFQQILRFDFAPGWLF